jgi:NitT/TauT family transport system substrate-binding protein
MNIRPIRLAAAALALLACWPSAPASAATKITLGYVTTMTISQAPVVFAIDLGYFKEEGLELEFLEFKGGTAILLPQLANKSVTIGYPNPDILVISRQPGHDPLPLKFFYNATPASVWEFAVLAKSPIASLKDLKGKKIGVGALTFGNIPITKALLDEVGIKADRDVELVPVGTGASAFLALTGGQVDALNLFDTQNALLETTGVAIRRLEMPEKYTRLFSNGYITHQDALKEHPEIFAGFGRAISKGTVACNANLAACAKSFWKHYPSQKPVGSEAQIVKDASMVLEARIKKLLYTPSGTSFSFGPYTDEGWQDFVDTLHRGGQIATKDIPIGSLYTNALVPEFNRFDVAATAAQAKALP